MRFTDRLSHAWNVFRGRDPTGYSYGVDYGPNYITNQRNHTFSFFGDGNIKEAICTRIAIDVAALEYHHVLLDDNDRFKEIVKDELDDRLNLSANVDQTGRTFIQDLVESLLDEGVVAVVPIETSTSPNDSLSYEIYSWRVGKVLDWYPKYVKVDIFNEESGMREQIIVPKDMTAIIENPLYSVMNSRNSTLQRLTHKLDLLDVVDDQIGSSKLDLLFQLPYTVRSPKRQEEAEKRRKDIELQLSGSKYGIAYIDATEKVTQLNRPTENNLLSQVQYLTQMVYGQLGITEEVMNGTADEKTMLNYYNRSVEPIAAAIVNEFKRKFLTKTARTRKHSIIFINNPFRLVPVAQIAEIADKFTRNEILTSNEVRGIIGFKPVDSARADELVNKNLNSPTDEQAPQISTNENQETIQNESE